MREVYRKQPDASADEDDWSNAEAFDACDYSRFGGRSPKPDRTAPVLLLSRDDAYAYLNKFVVAEITTTIRNIPVEVLLGRREGLRELAW